MEKDREFMFKEQVAAYHAKSTKPRRRRILGAPDLRSRTKSPTDLIKLLHEGLSFGELETLRQSLDLPMDKVASFVGISKATLHRRKAAGRLDPDESDRVVRFARLMSKAVDVLESESSARQWLNSPQHGLGGEVPLKYARTEVGAREVEDLLGRIEYGVYS